MTGQEIQSAINACIVAGGGKVAIPPGPHRIDAPLVFPAEPRFPISVLTPTVELAGDGINATTIHTLDPAVDLLNIARSNVRVSGMLLQGAQTAQGTGRGVVINDATNGAIIFGVRFSDVYIAATARAALYIGDGFPHLVGAHDFDQIAVDCSYERCTFDSNLGFSDLAYIGRWSTTQRFVGCKFTNFRGHALMLNEADTTSCRDCIFEAGDNSQPWVEGAGAVATLLDHCYFEDHALTMPLATFTKRDRASKGWAEPNCTYRRHS